MATIGLTGAIFIPHAALMSKKQAKKIFKKNFKKAFISSSKMPILGKRKEQKFCKMTFSGTFNEDGFNLLTLGHRHQMKKNPEVGFKFEDGKWKRIKLT